MRTKLIKLGNQLGVAIEPELLERAGISGEVELELSLEGGRLILEEAEASRRRRILEAAVRIMDENDETMRRLAL